MHHALLNRSFRFASWLVLALVAVVVGLSALSTQAALSFSTVTPLPSPGGVGTPQALAGDPIAAASGAVGGANTHAVQWSNTGTATQLSNAAGQVGQSFASGINSAGQASGYADISDGAAGQNSHAVRWETNHSATLLGDLAGLTTFASFANAINSTGETAGFLIPTAGGTRAVRWSSTGIATQLGAVTLQAQPALTYAYNINDAGIIVGRGSINSGSVDRAVRWASNGTATLLNDVPSQTTLNSRAYGLNATAQAAGNAELTSLGTRAVRWDADGSAVLLALVAGQTGDSAANSINDAGQVVGHAALAAGNRAVLWEADGSATLLQDLIPSGGWTLTDAYGIDTDNAVTRVLVQGSNPSVNGGATGLFLLTSDVPEPAGLALLTLALPLCRRCRK